MKKQPPICRFPHLSFSIACCAAGFLALLGPACCRADDWPTFGHDNRRSHVSGEALAVPLKAVWRYAGPPPQTAWPGPAKWDAYARIRNLASMRNFDPAYFVIAVGDRVWFGSSSDDSVHCLDAASGKTLWIRTLGGPVRVAPTWHEDRLYVGSDDGGAYCLDAGTGRVLWRYTPVKSEQWLANNGKLISAWPCRTGVLVQNGLAYCGMSLLPWQPSYLCALDPKTGRADPAAGGFVLKHGGFAMQGPLTASTDRLFLSQGRQNPVECDLRTGKVLGSLGNKGGSGGVWGLVTPEGIFIHGRGQNHGSNGEMREFDAAGRQQLVTFPKARRLAIADGMAYVLGIGTLRAFDWSRALPLHREFGKLDARRRSLEGKVKKIAKNKAKKAEVEAMRAELAKIRKKQAALRQDMAKCQRWTTHVEGAHGLMVCTGLVFVGGDGTVAAYDRATGEKRWSASVEGKAYGLAAAGGRLFVSTDTGLIQAFAAARP